MAERILFFNEKRERPIDGLLLGVDAKVLLQVDLLLIEF